MKMILAKGRSLAVRYSGDMAVRILISGEIFFECVEYIYIVGDSSGAPRASGTGVSVRCVGVEPPALLVLGRGQKSSEEDVSNKNSARKTRKVAMKEF